MGFGQGHIGQPLGFKNGFGSGGGFSPPSNQYIQEAIDFFDYMESIGDPVPLAYKTLYNNTIVALIATKGYDETTSLWDSCDVIRIEATYSKTAALKNLIRARGYGDATITNDYVGSFTADLGLKGNGTNFRVNCGVNFGDGLYSYKFTQNSATLGLYVTTNDTVGTTNGAHEVSSIGASSTGTYIRPMRTLALEHRMDAEITAAGIGNGTDATARVKNWFGLRRTGASSGTDRFQAGAFMNNDASTSAALGNANREFREFCANVVGAFSLFSSYSHGAIYFGNSNVFDNRIQWIIQKYFINPLNNATSKADSRVICRGDSMTNYSIDGTTSYYAESTRRMLASLGLNWHGVAFGVGGQGIETAAAQVNTNITPYRNTNLVNDIVIIQMGTNDLGHESRTGAEVYNDTITFAQACKNAGFKVIIIGIAARDGFFVGTNLAQFEIDRALVRTNSLADFSVPTSVANVYAPSVGITYADLYCDVYANSAFADPSDLTYYLADKVHLTKVGYEVLADDFKTPAVQLLAV